MQLEMAPADLPRRQAVGQRELDALAGADHLGTLLRVEDAVREAVAEWDGKLATTVPVQIALAEYLKHGGFDTHLRRLRRTLAAQEAAMVEAVETHFPEGTRLARPQGGYFLWLELPRQVDALTLHQQALAQGISIAPGPMTVRLSTICPAASITIATPLIVATRLLPALNVTGVGTDAPSLVRLPLRS